MVLNPRNKYFGPEDFGPRRSIVRLTGDTLQWSTAGQMLTGRKKGGVIERDGKVIVVGGTSNTVKWDQKSKVGTEICTLEKNEFFHQFDCKVNEHGLDKEDWKWLCKEAFGHDVCYDILTEDHYRDEVPYVFHYYEDSVALMPVPDNFCQAQ